MNKIVIDAALYLVLESYPQHTPLLKCQSVVCVTKGHKRLFLCQIFVALSNEMDDIQDEIYVDLLEILVYQLV